MLLCFILFLEVAAAPWAITVYSIFSHNKVSSFSRKSHGSGRARMSVSPVLTATRVVQTCSVPSPFVLHLSGASGASESEYEPVSKPVASTSRQPVIVNGKLSLNSKRIYKCIFDGCEKSYTKPCRLEEHERSHTGDVKLFTYLSLRCDTDQIFVKATIRLHDV